MRGVEQPSALPISLQPASSLLDVCEKLEVPPKMEAVMHGMYNESQMDAVTAGLDGSPLILVQGPPGERQPSDPCFVQHHPPHLHGD